MTEKYPYFKIDFIGCRVAIILDKEWLSIAATILHKEHLKNDERFINSNAIAFVKDNVFYIAAPKNVKHSTIYHECFHVLMEICDHFEFNIDTNNHEFQAYLLEYLINETVKIKNQKIRTIKKPAKTGTLTKAQIKKMVKSTIDKRKNK